MKIYLVLVLTSVFLFVYGQETCVRPNGGRGICVKYNLCPEIMTILDIPSERLLDLHQYKCGYEGRIPKVCCNDCYTPDGELGKCTHIDSCPTLYNILISTDQNKRAYLRNSRCLTGDRDVCCGPPPVQRDANADCKSTTSAFPPHANSGCCGYDVTASSRIVGGEKTGIDAYPWTVLLEYQTTSFLGQVQIQTYCAGSLISNRYVVTAAHCIVGGGAWAPINVRLGEHDTSTTQDCTDSDCADPVKVIPIEEIIVHHAYSTAPTSNNDNDIALIRMKSPVTYTDFIRPICLPNLSIWRRSDVFEVIVAGWGRVNSTHTSPVKQHVKLPLVKLQDCRNNYASSIYVRTPPVLNSSQICAGGVTGKDACVGDSGGPLMRKSGLFHELVGVVSYGTDYCGMTGLPGIYTNVHSFTVWIRNNIRP